MSAFQFFRFSREAKVFCIGRNKTGTTSLGALLRQLGYRLGDQAAAEMLLRDWSRRDFRQIVKYCQTADAFQDIPFSLDDTYQAVDGAYPGSKFILSLRESAQQWYDSLVRSHTRLLGKGRRPTAQDLQEFSYRYRGWLWENAQMIYGVNESTLYDRDLYMAHYQAHNEGVRAFFRHRPDDLLVVNVGEPSAVEKICRFLGKSPAGQQMPFLNRNT